MGMELDALNVKGLIYMVCILHGIDLWGLKRESGYNEVIQFRKHWTAVYLDLLTIFSVRLSMATWTKPGVRHSI